MAQNPFETLGLEPGFHLDPDVIQRAWLRKSARLHPDRGGGASDAGDEIARLNDAKRILDDPESRGRALLDLLQPESGQDERSLPDGFLVEMLEVREALEQAQEGGNAQAIADHEAWAQERRESHIQRVGELFDAFQETGDRSVLSDLRREFNAWRYIERMLEQLDLARDA